MVEALLALSALVLHLVLMLAAAPLLVGLEQQVTARLQGRAGAALLQPWRDVLRGLRKSPVVAQNASWLWHSAPASALAVLIAAAALVPSFTMGMASAAASDLLVVAGLLALARAILALAAMDAGTAAGGLYASRVMTRAVFAEPALMAVAFAIALPAGGTNLNAIAAGLRDSNPGLLLALVPLLLALLALVVQAGTPGIGGLATPTGPDVLEYAGRDLALIAMAAALRRLVWLGLVATLVLPIGIAPPGAHPAWWLVGVGSWLLKVTALAAGLAIAQAVIAVAAPRLPVAALGLAFLLAMLGMVLLFAGQEVG